jgi:hypothetical protein
MKQIANLQIVCCCSTGHGCSEFAWRTLSIRWRVVPAHDSRYYPIDASPQATTSASTHKRRSLSWVVRLCLCVWRRVARGAEWVATRVIARSWSRSTRRHYYVTRTPHTPHTAVLFDEIMSLVDEVSTRRAPPLVCVKSDLRCSDPSRTLTGGSRGCRYQPFQIVV